MLLGNAHIKKTLGEEFRKLMQTGSLRHCSGNRDNRGVFCGQFHEALAEDLGVGGCAAGVLNAVAGVDFEAAASVEIDRVLLGGRVALAFFGGHVQQHRLLQRLDVVKDVDQVIEVVTVDGAEVGEAEGLEQHPGSDESFK